MADSDDAANSGSRTPQSTTVTGMGQVIPLPKALTLSSGDHPGLLLSTVLMNGKNYFSWSYRVWNTLASKSKTGFLTGSQTKPMNNSVELDAWREVDSLIQTWLLNSIVPQLQEPFVYVNSAKELWERVRKKFGQSNESMIYRFRKMITSLKQGEETVATYSTKLEGLWKELACLDPPVLCTCGSCVCGVNKRQMERQERDLLVQFLTGLEDSYEVARSQILVIDPLPDMEKACSIIMQMESQKEIQMSNAHSAFAVDLSAQSQQQFTKKFSDKRFNDKRQQVDKKNWFCDYCKKKGHLKETCFKLHGTPEWYKELVSKKNIIANVSTTELTGSNSGSKDSDILSVVRGELQRLKLLEKEQGSNSPIDFANTAFAYNGPGL